MKSVSKKDRRRGGGGRAPSLREKPVCGLSSHSAKLRAEKQNDKHEVHRSQRVLVK